MTKITFVVPYTEKRELVGLINRIVAESDCPDNVRFDILHSKDRVDDSSAYWDSDIVIARGLAYSVLKQERRNFHLIEDAHNGCVNRNFRIGESHASRTAGHDQHLFADASSHTVHSHKAVLQFI